MSAYALLTATGSDRVGIVDDLTRALLEVGCNVEESRMALLGGEFALIALVSGTEASVRDLLGSLSRIGADSGLSLAGRPTRESSRDQKGRPYQLESVSLDTPGIVHSVTGLLRRNGINIDDLQTETGGAPFTGAPMFRMRATIIVPQDVKIADLRSDLEKLALEQDLDLTLRPVGMTETESR